MHPATAPRLPQRRALSLQRRRACRDGGRRYRLLRPERALAAPGCASLSGEGTSKPKFRRRGRAARPPGGSTGELEGASVDTLAGDAERFGNFGGSARWGKPSKRFRQGGIDILIA